jgi:SET and MYND domain-containing protein
MCIKIAEGSAPVLGTTLDLVGSFMNHSCDPNAFVFFEGSQMRVRTLRPLRAGEEITQTYVDLSGSVFSRQVTTQKDYFFKCACKYI